MLTQLTIQNFAIVRFLELDLHAGMTCITGETGAGKSIAIDALGLCLGERAEGSMVRPGAERSEITARFALGQQPEARRWLQENGLHEEGECLLRRVITAEGRSRAYINGTPVPLTQLNHLGQLLINIHGQHAHQLLLRPEHQLDILDAYAGHHGLLEETRTSYRQWHASQQELQRLRQAQQAREARRQLLEYQVEELDQFALQPGEYEEVEQEHSRLSNRGELLSTCQASLDLLHDNEEVSLLGLFNQASRQLDQLCSLDDRLQPICQMLEEARIQVEEGHQELQRYLDRLELDPERLAWLEERMSRTLTLARKHHVRPAELAAHHQQLAEELASLGRDDARVESLADELQQWAQQYRDSAQRLSLSRQQHAQALSLQISERIQALAMPEGQLAITVENQPQTAPSPLGSDSVQFLVTTNRGQPLQPLAKVASGGELSRISLAIQVITAERIATPTLIFDEVDVGNSGPTASVVGRLLRELGRSTQVLVVTHLPQVAGQGHHHLYVSKQHHDSMTETSMQTLDQKGRLDELARLLGGDQITRNTMANARELLATGR